MAVKASYSFVYSLSRVSDTSLKIDLPLSGAFKPPSGVSVTNGNLKIRGYFPKSTDLIRFGYFLYVNDTLVASNNDNPLTTTAKGGVKLQLYSNFNESYPIRLPEGCIVDGTETVTLGIISFYGGANAVFSNTGGTYGTFSLDSSITSGSINNPSSLAVNNTIVDNPTTFSWVSGSGKTKSVFNLYLGGTVVNTQTLTGSTSSCIIPGAALAEGNYTFGVKDSILLTSPDYNGNQLGLESTETTKAVTFSKVYPSVSALEPDKINLNRNNNITVTWSATNYSSFELQVLQNSSVIATYTGTTQSQLIIPSGTIPAGTTQLKLTVTRTGTGYTTTAVKTSEFLAYGNPKAPTQDGNKIYNTTAPTFTWATGTGSSDSPIAWRLQLFQGSTLIEDSGDVLGNAGTYTVTTTLSNHTEYVVKVRVKNQFSLWSTWSEKAITITFTDLPKANFEIIVSKNDVVLNIVNTEHAMFKNSEVWRKDSDGGTWVRIAYNLGRITTFKDYTLESKKSYDYKIRSNAYDGAMSESDVKSASITVEGFRFINVEDLGNPFTIYRNYGNNNVSVDVTYNHNIDATVYAGNVGATLETDGVEYRTIGFEFEMSYNERVSFLKLLKNSKVLLYKDERGNKCYGGFLGNISEKHVDFDGYNISFNFIEVNFLEKDIYSGDGGLRVAYLNGQYLLNASLLLNGTVVE